MMMYDPTTFGTPLTLLQIPAQAISDVQGKLQEPGCVVARYTQDCSSLQELSSALSAPDRLTAAETMVDVGYICRKCHMVYPGQEACVTHQQMLCYQGSKPQPGDHNKTILKLEQIQYLCNKCHLNFSTVHEFKVHCDMEMHKHKMAAASSSASTSSPSVTSSSSGGRPPAHGHTHSSGLPTPTSITASHASSSALMRPASVGEKDQKITA